MLAALRDNLGRIGFFLLLALAGAAAVVLEFRYSYVEVAIGRYLTWHNAERTEFGQVWENVTASEDVQQRLDALVVNRREQESPDIRVDDLGQLLELAAGRERLILTRERFLDIYSRLPYYQSSMLIEPLHLLDISSRLAQWQRTMLTLEQGELNVFLLDGQNAVLEKILLAREYVDFFLDGRRTRGQPLEAIPSLNQPFYPADVFFDSMLYLSADEREGIPVTAGELLQWRYRLQRVAVARDSLVGDRMEMAFELGGVENQTTVRVLGRSLSVLQLAQRMDELLYQRYPDRRPGADTLSAPAVPPASGETPESNP
ncbi:hypothetical protein LLH00_07725 [bacterium]|nr:hypothetical protein [bacterium]